MVDFTRMDAGKQTVERIEYDPGRTAHIALLRNNATKKLSYILAAQGMRAGDVVESFRQGVPQELLDSLGGSTDAGMIAARTAWRGNCLPLHMIPTGTIVYNVGLYPKKGAQICRSAGTFAMVTNKNDDHPDDPKKALYVDVRLRSGEVRKIHRDACATIGVASNNNQFRRQLGKAGRSRWLGIRPTVRGVAMNANEHPHGGGRGKSKGNVVSQSIWGTLVCFINIRNSANELTAYHRQREVLRREVQRRSTASSSKLDHRERGPRPRRKVESNKYIFRWVPLSYVQNMSTTCIYKTERSGFDASEIMSASPISALIVATAFLVHIAIAQDIWSTMCEDASE